MEPLAAMAKQLAAALNQAAESFAFVKKELAETKAALAQIKKQNLKDRIASMEQHEENIKQVNEAISLLDETPDEAVQRVVRHRIIIVAADHDTMDSARYQSTAELMKNTSRWETEN
ncbi:hypothetical protein D6D04_04241 [Aureobasidium pullulans]|nr:hypothetical protein D6D04_04241 [Aureobasidium pullulans]